MTQASWLAGRLMIRDGGAAAFGSAHPE